MRTTASSSRTRENYSAAMAKVANEPAICVSAPRCYIQRIEQRMEPPFHSGFVGRATATFEKRIPVNSCIIVNGSSSNCIAGIKVPCLAITPSAP
jgi:hypothetical protein